MPNAWFYYLIPLILSIVFTCAGVQILRQSLRGPAGRKGDKSRTPPAFVGVLVLLIGGTLGLGLVFTSPPPWERQRIFDHVFRTPPEQIQRFVIKPARAGAYRPLTKTEVVIDDPARIRRIADALRAGREVSPNHPRTHWTAEVEMFTRDGGTYFFEVSATEPGDLNGTLVRATAGPAANRGWNLGDVRADGLESLLEDAVNEAGKR